ncbi:uracil-DNA glycosylase [Malikia spinosa]|uniref:Uracil-DNA glycosylase n=1 Tax=Malikia spinosa TaxID=86180 RepID=A0A2S9KDQ1_9BURK|nr:uracil-DNA glycosylase [Malikia spinosa]PRD68536.1 uracil-DNA glycosylase [Malikia spinosa]
MNALREWAPERWPAAADWQPVLQPFWASAAGQGLARFVQARLQAGAEIYPAQPLRALELTPLAEVSVVILGQDPYHGPGQAEGLAFSVPAGVRLPPSLRNIFQELTRDLGGVLPASGSLQGWAQQGVLLLNTCLTVEQGSPASHAKQGWETLTDALIAACSAHESPKVFLLWGAHAQSKLGLIDASRHLVLQANHPSPLSARRPPRPFIGCGHFGQARQWLEKKAQKNLHWL